jgi:cytochrome c biogenesis protein CcmG/thiol:disulfide interchange protein DsbE
MNPRLAVVPLALLLLSLPLPASARNSGRPAPPTTVPAFSLPERHGTVSSAALAGKVVYVDFWASWCGPCRMSFPWLKTLHERYAPKGLVVVAINLDKSRDAAEEFLGDYPAPFLVAFDPAGTTADAFNVGTMPSSYLIGPDGAVLYSQAGFDPKETGKVEHLIQEALGP